MSVSLPYLSTVSAITTALEKIRTASTPERITVDFVNTILQIKGGTGNTIIPFLKKIGMVSSDGSPTELYKRFRNQSNGASAIADAIKIGYKPLIEVNEYFYKLDDSEFKDLVIQVTGLDNDNTVLNKTCATYKNLKAFANFDISSSHEDKEPVQMQKKEVITIPQSQHNSKLGLNLSYTINLNLPSTTDQAVFNAIFKSLKEHLLKDE